MAWRGGGGAVERGGRVSWGGAVGRWRGGWRGGGGAVETAGRRGGGGAVESLKEGPSGPKEGLKSLKEDVIINYCVCVFSSVYVFFANLDSACRDLT